MTAIPFVLGPRQHSQPTAGAHLSPLDRGALLGLARHTSRVLIVQEDSRTGGIGESLAAIVQEEAFEWLDAPVRIVGSLDTPVPHAPPLGELLWPKDE